MKTSICINRNLSGLGQSPTLAINERVKRMRNEGRAIYNFGLGQSPFPVPDCVVDALRLNATEKAYLPVEGLQSLRTAVAEFWRVKGGVGADPECVIIGPGSKELLFLLQVVFDGTILIPTPCWVSYTPQAQIVGRGVRYIHTTFEDKWLIMPDHFRQICQEAYNEDGKCILMVLNYPANPNGTSYTPEELQEIADVAREFNVIILSDEIYGELNHRGEHVSMVRYYPEGTIVSSGLSKWCGAGGWRLGTFLFPEHLRHIMAAMAVVASETYTSVSAPIQYAAVRAFRGGMEIETYLQHVRRVLAVVGRQCAKTLQNAGVRVHTPEGGFYLFADFGDLADKLKTHGISNSRELCDRMLEETGVAALPGASFERPTDELSMRLAYVDFDGAKALVASRATPLYEGLPANFSEHYAPNVLEGVRRIAAWLDGLAMT